MEDVNVIDATNDLVKASEVTEEQCTCERSITELESEKIENLTKEEIKFLINGLKMKNKQLDNLTQKLFKEIDAVRAKANSNLEMMEDTLTYIKSTVGNSYTAVTLAIKNMEREVK